jgi:hypothetical protein
MDRKLQSMIFHDRIDAANKMQTRQEKTDSPSTLDYSSVRMMALFIANVVLRGLGRKSFQHAFFLWSFDQSKGFLA